MKFSPALGQTPILLLLSSCYIFICITLTSYYYIVRYRKTAMMKDLTICTLNALGYVLHLGKLRQHLLPLHPSEPAPGHGRGRRLLGFRIRRPAAHQGADGGREANLMICCYCCCCFANIWTSFSRGSVLVGYQPLAHKGLGNCFRVVLPANPAPTKQDMDYLIREIEDCGKDL